MTNNYTEHAKIILARSRQEVHRLKSSCLQPEHILLGILSDGEGKAIQILKNRGVNLQALRDSVEISIQQHETLYNDTVIHSSVSLNTPIGDEPLATESDRALKLSQLEARMLKHSGVDAEHLMLALLKDSNSVLAHILKQYQVDYKSFQSEIKSLLGSAVSETEKEELPMNSRDDMEEDGNQEEAFASSGGVTQTQSDIKEDSQTPLLDRFGFDMTKAAMQGKLDPVVGRAVEIERIQQILSRRRKNNPILLGEPGVGKTAIVEGLAQRIARGEVNFLLKDKRLINLDLAALVAGTKFRGQFEERIKGIIRELKQNPNIIVYIDEIHIMVGAGGAEGSMDAANMLKPALSRGEIQCIGSTTIDEFRKRIEKDGALERRFQKVIVEPTSPEETLEILKNLRESYQEHHCVTYTDEALKACVDLTERYISDRNFPDKAIDALDEAGSKMHLADTSEPNDVLRIEQQIAEVKKLKDQAILQQHYEEAATHRDRQRQLEIDMRSAKESWLEAQRKNRPVVDAEKIADTVSQMTGIPVHKVASTEGQKLLELKKILSENVVGQETAIGKVVRAIQRNRVGLKDPKKPIGTFLFLGPTGVGKTYLAKKIADELFATKDSLIRIDMSEFMEKYSTSRLIGAAPGYVGYDEGGQLTERVRRHPYSVVLFDEIEKADREVFNLMLQLFDEGHLTDSQGRKVDFKNCIIILTSNVGSRHLGDFGTGIGFQNYSVEQQQAAADAVIQKELKKTFSPEFLNRIDDIITFQQLQPEHIRAIVDIELNQVLPRIEQQGYSVTVSDSVRDFLGQKGYDKSYGARPLKRAIQQYIEDALCEGMLLNQDGAKRSILIDMQEGIPTATFGE
ncbi:MAG: ATP-dependent Clp protease ATP-binding subunit [Bacteroidales bacterium]|nr:ATP-dependent Clp protease ATP-binding subunit [Bacteroidales bacterium]